MNDRAGLTDTACAYREILDHTNDAIIILQGEHTVWANKPARKYFAATEWTEAKEIFLPHFLKKQDLMKLQNIIHHVISYGQKESVATIRLPVIIPDGTVIQSEIHIHPFTFHHTPLVQLTIRDIRDIKNAELNLMQSEKLSVIGELSAGILHEIRNPLTSIKGFLQLMQKDPVPDKNYIEIILNEVNHIENIATGLLNFTKPQPEHFVKLELGSILKNTLFLFETHAVRKHISFDVIGDGDAHLILGDKTQMKQVFINLIKNAIDAIDDDGKISISLISADSREIIKISDSGKGMPSTIITKLGKSFFTTKVSGTGLGLMVTFKIINNHNGKVSIESKENRGTTFTLTFPCYSVARP